MSNNPVQDRRYKYKIAIVTRTKNRSILLKRAIASVDSQSYSDYIHVILNDGGDQRVVNEIIKESSNGRRTVLHNETSVGLTKALNQAIKLVDSEYIAVLDDDDTISSNRLELVVNFLDKTHAKGVVNVMDRVLEHIKGSKIIQDGITRLYPGITSISLYKQCLDNYLSAGCFTYRRDVYNELDGYNENLSDGEDWDFGIRFMLKYDVEFIDTEKALSFYHQRPTQNGDYGNSVFANRQKSRINALRNKYLRDDILNGKFSLGYIMNDLAYRRESGDAEFKKDIDNVVRLEGHINYNEKN